jgi:hypothetical protein
MLESMPNEEYSPEGVNLGPEGAKSAWGEVIRPGKGNPVLGQGNPGLAQPGHEGNQRGQVWLAGPAGSGEAGPVGEGYAPAQPGRRPGVGTPDYPSGIPVMHTTHDPMISMS